ncbi:MAG: hypothetical protein H6595_03575 [Flavobacteriales bacterium]|nr:hypothetical protein [Flavobacteriales bacterium]MCB9166539.1 hypothetical protein [Flavobacteriales bacterium]
MANVTAASNPSTNDPRMSGAGTVNKTQSKKGTNDTVSVDVVQVGLTADGKHAEVVLKIGSSGRVTMTVNTDGSATVNATGSGTTDYSILTLSTADPNNWTITVKTQDGSVYQFVKGHGGGGH